MHFNSLIVDRTGMSVLGTKLISQGQVFPAGTAVSSRLGLDTFRIGYRAHCLLPEWLGWRLTSEVGFAMSRFQYTLHSADSSRNVDRRYNVSFLTSACSSKNH